VICGAEPIRVEVMHSFFDYFSKCGFNPKALMPAYGLAEFTLCATSQPSGRALNILHVDQQVRDLRLRLWLRLWLRRCWCWCWW
jgi:acyl-CoA synthetase (AMP-forming)/AMP-acid ligase II